MMKNVKKSRVLKKIATRATPENSGIPVPFTTLEISVNPVPQETAVPAKRKRSRGRSGPTPESILNHPPLPIFPKPPLDANDLPIWDNDDIAFLAGLFEGEGSFGVRKARSKHRADTGIIQRGKLNLQEEIKNFDVSNIKGTDPAPRPITLKLEMTDCDVVCHAVALFHANVCLPTRKTSSALQTYQFSSEKRALVAHFCEKVFPHMGNRRQATIVDILKNNKQHKAWHAAGGASEQARNAAYASHESRARMRP